MERGGDCHCCLCLSQGGADATLDCRLRRWPEVGFGEIAINLPKSRFWSASGWRDHRDIGLGGELMGRQLFAGSEHRHESDSVLRRFVATCFGATWADITVETERIPRDYINRAYV